VDEWRIGRQFEIERRSEINFNASLYVQVLSSVAVTSVTSHRFRFVLVSLVVN